MLVIIINDKRYFRRFELYYDDITTTPDVVDPDGFAELMRIPIKLAG